VKSTSAKAKNSYDVALLASTFKEPISDTLKFIIYHSECIRCQNYSAILVIVFESSERSIAETAMAEVQSRKLGDRALVLINENGLGFPSCLNYGIRSINARYIMRIDTDDVCCPNRIQKQVEAMEGSNLDLCYGWMTTESGSILKYPSTSLGMWTAISLGQNPIPHPTVCIKKELILGLGLYNETLSRAEDFELWIKVLRSRRPKIRCLKEPLTMYSLARARDKNRENALAQIRIRIKLLSWSVDSIAIIAGLFVNYARLFVPTRLLLAARRSL
jgi:glycosyltransferase involved in cell wall biosynthesis